MTTNHTAPNDDSRPTVRHPARAVALIAVLCVLVLVVAFGTPWVGRNSESVVGAPPVVSSAQSDTSTDNSVGADSEVAGVEEALQRAVDAAVAQVGGAAGIAISDGTATWAAGDDAAYPAWSTIKVPLAIAALRQDPSVMPLARAAITVSDNAAAQSLNDSLPAGAVDEVLAEAGLDVALNTEPVRPEFSTFGQTQWSASQEALFAANLSCVVGAGDVLDLMGQVSADQAYGLGQLPGARTKAGWGPDIAGMYQVRQLGLVEPSVGSTIAVGITALPADGTYQSGQQMAAIMANELAQSVDMMPISECTR